MDPLFSAVLPPSYTLFIITARRYASAVYAVVMSPSAIPSVRVSHAGIVSKRLNVESRKQRHTVAQRLQFSDAKNLGEIPTESPATGAPNG